MIPNTLQNASMRLTRTTCQERLRDLLAKVIRRYRIHVQTRGFVLLTEFNCFNEKLPTYFIYYVRD